MHTYIVGKEPYFTFDVTEENQAAMATVEEFAQEEGPQLLCIYGEKGTGKSHLATVAKEILDENGFMVRTLTEFHVIEKAISWVEQGKPLYDFFRTFEQWDGLILEDIQNYNDTIQGKDMEAVQTAIINLINHFWIWGKKILITCDCHPKEQEWLAEVEPLFVKAFLSKPSDELKRIVLRSYEHIAGIDLPKEVGDMIIARSKTIGDMKNTFNQAIVRHQCLEEELNQALIERITR